MAFDDVGDKESGKKLKSETRIERMTYRSAGDCSTTELLGRAVP